MRTRRRPLGRYAVFLLAVAALVLGSRALLGGGDDGEPLLSPGDELSREEITEYDPFAWDENREEEFLERGRDGYSHVLYEKSPGGVPATAGRVEALRERIEKAADAHDVDADTLEALVFLESGGRPEVIAGDSPENAVGLGQILPGTAVDLLGMSVDLERSKQLTRRIRRESRRATSGRTRARRRAAARRAVKLAAERRRIDERFDPDASLDGAGRYLAIAQERFGREDFATASYHMGMGNLEQVIATYVAPRRPRDTVAATVDEYGLSYPQVFFDSTPVRNPRTYAKLVSLGDDSRTYLFRLEASREIMRLWREDRDELERLNGLHLEKGSAEEVLRPSDDTETFGDADDVRDAYDDGDLVELPSDPRRLAFSIDRNMGSLAPRLGEERQLYRGLQPDALATLLFVAKEVRRSLPRATLRVTSTVRDRAYQELLIGINSEATQDFSLHTTGFAIDIARSRRYERTLSAVLDRLRALNVIAFVVEPGAYHLTVGPDGERFAELRETLAPSG